MKRALNYCNLEGVSQENVEVAGQGQPSMERQSLQGESGEA